MKSGSYYCYGPLRRKKPLWTVVLKLPARPHDDTSATDEIVKWNQWEFAITSLVTEDGGRLQPFASACPVSPHDRPHVKSSRRARSTLRPVPGLCLTPPRLHGWMRRVESNLPQRCLPRQPRSVRGFTFPGSSTRCHDLEFCNCVNAI